ncbi:MAG: phytanoyl-CoA dioxygenase family protein [Reichenbachiella sp.]
MEVKELANRFWQEGYLHLEGFFNDQLMDEFNTLILNHFGMNPTFEHSPEFIAKAATEVVPWFPMRDDGVMDFEKLDGDSRFVGITHEILGDNWNDLYCMSMFSKKGTKGQAWHQDCPPEDHSQYNLNRLVYTHDITEQIGGEVIVMPRTHRGGPLSIGEPHEDIAGQVILKPKKGDVVILHGHTWHRVLPIRGVYRVSTNFRAMPEGTPEDITDIAVYRNMRFKFSTSEVIEVRE